MGPKFAIVFSGVEKQETSRICLQKLKKDIRNHTTLERKGAKNKEKIKKAQCPKLTLY